MISEDFRKQAREKLAGKWGKAVLIILAYMFITWLIGFVGGLFDNTAIGGLISLCQTLIGVPLAYGLIHSFIKTFDNEEISVFDFVSSGFNNFGRSWGVVVYTFLKMLLPIVIIILAIILITGGLLGSVMPVIRQYTTIGDLNMALSTIDASSINGSALLFSLVGFILLIIGSILNITWSYYYKIAYVVAIDNPDLTTKEAVNKSKEYMTGNRWKLFCLEFSFIGWAILATLTLGIGFLWLFPYIQVAEIAFARFVCGKKEEPAPIDIKTEESPITNPENN